MVSLGRVIGGTVYPGLTLTVGTIWCLCVHSSNFLSKCILGYLPVNKGSEGYWSWTNGTRCALALSSPLGRLSLALASPSAMRVSVQTPEIAQPPGQGRQALPRSTMFLNAVIQGNVVSIRRRPMRPLKILAVNLLHMCPDLIYHRS